MSKYVENNGTQMVVRPHPKPWPWGRALADLLTLSRLVGGLFVASTSWDRSETTLGRLVLWSLLLWSTDAVDGKVARRSGMPASWLGRNEILVDAALALAIGMALARSGFISGTLLALWLGVCLLLYAVRPVDTVILTFMVPLHLALPVLVAFHGLPAFRLYVLWVLLMAALNRTRLKWVIEVFIDGLPNPIQKWVWSWLPAWMRLSARERASFQRSGDGV